MKDQLEKLMKAEGLSPAKFADEIGVQRSSISHILSGRNKPSYDFISKILVRFQGINADWLLTGKGSMIKGQDPLHTNKDEGGALFEFSSDRVQSTAESAMNERNRDVAPPVDPIHAKSTQSTYVNKQRPKQQFTNVNDVDYILVFYKDGSFSQYNARD